jgi:hypothetical protein
VITVLVDTEEFSALLCIILAAEMNFYTSQNRQFFPPLVSVENVPKIINIDPTFQLACA